MICCKCPAELGILLVLTIVSQNVCAVHEAEVGSSVEHVEVNAAIGAENIAQNYP